jgi:long-chain acyl-CoA synthetase
MTFALQTLIAKPSSNKPTSPLLKFQGQTWSAEELENRSTIMAQSLASAGVEVMDRVAILLTNRTETVLTYLACFKGGFVLVPLDYRHHGSQLKYAVSHSGATVLIVHRDRYQELEDEGILSLVERVYVVGEQTTTHKNSFETLLNHHSRGTLTNRFDADQLCMMIYTSGTTSRPKGVTFTRGAIEDGIHKYLARVPLSCEDCALVAAPITRPMALRSQLLPLLAVGGCACLIESFECNHYVAALMDPPQKTVLALLPAAWSQVLRHPDLEKVNFRGLRLALTGGDATPINVHREFSRITGHELTEQYGSSEVGPISINPPFGRKKLGSVGLPMYGAQVMIVDDNDVDLPSGETGKIVIRSQYAMDGYWNDTALTRKTIFNGTIRTGDLGRFDEDGYLWFMGRNRDLIIRGGSNISPFEVESTIKTHEDVVDACVVGVSHPELGQTVEAFVQLNPGVIIAPEALQSYLSSRLAAYMVPERIHWIDELPLKGAGKIDRDKLQLRAETQVYDL